MVAALATGEAERESCADLAGVLGSHSACCCVITNAHGSSTVAQ